MPPLFVRRLDAHRSRFLRVALSHYVLNGTSAALGLFLISITLLSTFGVAAAAQATVGVIAALAPDMVGPRRGKLAQLVVAPLISVPLFWAVQLLHPRPVALGLLLVTATFFAFLGMAWGKRGAPVAIGVMLCVVFSLSLPVTTNLDEALRRTAFCAFGATVYVLYAVLANLALNARYRTTMTADLLLTLAALMQTHARRVDPDHTPVLAEDGRASGRGPEGKPAGLGDLLKRQAALADQIQSTRDVVLESPRTAHRQRLAGMLMVVLEMRDHLVASELDLERIRLGPDQSQALQALADIYRAMAGDVTRVADGLLLHRTPALAQNHNARLAALRRADLAAEGSANTPHDLLLRGLTFRVGHQNDAVRHLSQLARGEAQPDLTVVRNSWRLFVSPTDWTLQPFMTLWHWRQPALRHAVRAALAMATGYIVAQLLPWGTHAYWIFLTIIVVLRGSLAQTLERRNQRVAGTVIGSLLATGLLVLHPPTLLLFAVVTVGQGVVHGFALRRYVITAVAGSVMGLVQGHLLYAGSSATFALFERIGDTLLGAGIAWAFAYVLPSWERGQLGNLVHRVLRALDQHARQSLSLAAMDAIDTDAELTWRLARKEAYDALSALVQATGRALAEPRAVQPPLIPLEQLQGHSYQLLGQLSAIKSLLLLRRSHLQLDEIAQPLARATAKIAYALESRGAGQSAPHETPADSPASVPVDLTLPAVPETLPDPYEQDVTPWLLRRLHLSLALAERVHGDAEQVLALLTPDRPPAQGAHRPTRPAP